LGYGSSTTQACGFNNSGTFFQQTSNLNFSGNVYRNNANCENSSCDWSAFALYIANGVTWSNPEVSCGSAISTGSCGGPYSDVRLKHGIETLKGAIENIMKIEAVEYDWNENLNYYEYFKTQEKLHTIGLIAQNVRLYYPEVVRMNEDGYYSIDYTKLNAVLVEGIKEQSIFINNIDKELEYIESKLS
jgi:hypothetical protein